MVVRRGIPSTLNTPSLDPVLMYDGRLGSLESQVAAAIRDHAQAKRLPTAKELEQIAVFERTRPFFSSRNLWEFAWTGHAPELPRGRTASEKRGRHFFEDVPFGPGDPKGGLCAACHSGAMLNETNQFIPAPPFRRGGRFQTVLVSELNEAGNPVIDFLFKNPDGTTTPVSSPDPGRALITGRTDVPENLNAFKIPTLWGVAQTAPYFHDNSAKTLEDVVKHYAEVLCHHLHSAGRRPPRHRPDRAGSGRYRGVPQAASIDPALSVRRSGLAGPLTVRLKADPTYGGDRSCSQFVRSRVRLGRAAHGPPEGGP